MRLAALELLHLVAKLNNLVPQLGNLLDAISVLLLKRRRFFFDVLSYEPAGAKS
jgi:hypothetical protein